MLFVQLMSFWVGLSSALSLALLSVFAFRQDEQLRLRVVARRQNPKSKDYLQHSLPTDALRTATNLDRKRAFRSANLLLYAVPRAYFGFYAKKE